MSQTRAPLASFDGVKDFDELARRLNQLARTIDLRLRPIEKALTNRPYTVTGVVTTARTIDAAAGTLADVRNLLVTLVQDLQNEKELL